MPKSSLGLGWFSDVAFAGDGDHGIVIAGFVKDHGTEIRLYAWAGLVLPDASSVPFFVEPMAQGYGYGRVHCDPSTGHTFAGWHDGSTGHVINLTTKQRWAFPECEGSSPIAFGGSYAAIQGRGAQGYPVTLLILASGAITPVVRLGKPTGLARVEGTDAAPRVIDNDENRGLFAGATNPDFAGDLTVGEGPDNGTKWRLTDGHVGVLWPGELTYTPKCASGVRFAVTTGGSPGGVRLFVGDRIELIGAAPADPGLENRIKALEMKVANLEASDANQNNAINGLRGTVNNHEARIAALEAGGGGGGTEPPVIHVPNRADLLAQFHQEYNGGRPVTDLDDKHRFTASFVPWLNAREPDANAKGRYGRKSRESSPDIVSKDTIGYWLGAKPVPTTNTNGLLDAVDIIDSSGNVSWDTRAEQGDPAYHAIRALWMPIP
jgi:hypothetical protein